MAKAGWKSTHQVNFDGPSGIKGQRSFYSVSEAMSLAREAIAARRVRGPEDHVVLTDKATGLELVRWVGNGEGDEFLFVSPEAEQLGYDQEYFTEQED